MYKTEYKMYERIQSMSARKKEIRRRLRGCVKNVIIITKKKKAMFRNGINTREIIGRKIV